MNILKEGIKKCKCGQHTLRKWCDKCHDNFIKEFRGIEVKKEVRGYFTPVRM